MGRIKDTRRSFDEGGGRKKTKKKITLSPNVPPLWYQLVKQVETWEAKSSLRCLHYFWPAAFYFDGLSASLGSVRETFAEVDDCCDLVLAEAVHGSELARLSQMCIPIFFYSVY